MDEEIIHCIKISGEEAHLVILFRLMKSERPAARGARFRGTRFALVAQQSNGALVPIIGARCALATRDFPWRLKRHRGAASLDATLEVLTRRAKRT
ncbi:MAG: hypothetical protein WB820_08805 [Rhodoplanes sp.]